jgi:hypothetical protein
MTAQLKTLDKPSLPNAVGDVLYVHNLPDPTPGVVPSYGNATQGDVVKFRVVTSTGNTWQESYVLIAGDVGKPITFQIKKETFEKNLTSGATADVHYTLTRGTGRPVQSPVLQVRLER